MNPTTKVVKIHINGSIMLTLSNAKASSSATVESREDNSWDIWGTGDDFED